MCVWVVARLSQRLKSFNVFWNFFFTPGVYLLRGPYTQKNSKNFDFSFWGKQWTKMDFFLHFSSLCLCVMYIHLGHRIATKNKKWICVSRMANKFFLYFTNVNKVLFPSCFYMLNQNSNQCSYDKQIDIHCNLHSNAHFPRSRKKNTCP